MATKFSPAVSGSKEVELQDQPELLPRFKTVVQRVDLRPEIETRLNMMVPDLKAEFLYRIVSFSLSGTCLVDLKRTTQDEASCTAQAKMACALSNKHLTRLLTNSVMSKRKGMDIIMEGGSKKVFLSDSFQEIMNIKLFGLNVSIELWVFHDNLRYILS